MVLHLLLGLLKEKDLFLAQAKTPTEFKLLFNACRPAFLGS
jgi:hypothetical protein